MKHPRQLEIAPAIAAGYAMGSLATGIYTTVPGVLLLFYLTQSIGLNPATAGLVIAVPKLLDIAADPLFGILSDRTQSCWGRRRPFLLAGAFLLPVSLIALFNLPVFASEFLTALVASAVFGASALAYSLFAVPYLAMPAESSRDPAERTALSAWRMGFALTGSLLGAALAPKLVAFFGGGRDAYRAMAFIIAALSACGMLTAFFATRWLPVVEGKRSTADFSLQLRGIMRSRPFLSLAATLFFSLVGLSCAAAAVPYFAAFKLKATQAEAGTFLGLMIGTSALTTWVWVLMARRFGSRKALGLALATFAVGIGMLVFVQDNAVSKRLLAHFVVLGVALSGAQMLPYAMLTDVIRDHERKTGQPCEAFVIGIWVAVEKAGYAFGPVIAGGILASGGFTARETVNGDQAIGWGLDIALAIFPAIATVAALLFLAAFRLREPEHASKEGTPSTNLA